MSIYPAASQVIGQILNSMSNVHHFDLPTDSRGHVICIFMVTLVLPQMQGDSIKVALKPTDLQTNMFAFVYSTKILRR